MIRDPSDGSVKEIPGPSAAPVNAKSVSLRPRPNCADHDAAAAENQSGLPPTSSKAAYLERLAKSHEWLTEYFKRNIG